MIEKDIQKIAIEISKERSGVPVLISDLRKRIDMSNWAFDRAIVAMAKDGHFLTRNAHPTDSLTNAEKKMMIPDGAGNYYFAINPRDDAEYHVREARERQKAAGAANLQKHHEDSGHNVEKPLVSANLHELPEEKKPFASNENKSSAKAGKQFNVSGRGGIREGAGRPAVKIKVKRVQLQGARIPGWLMDWLKAEGDMGSKIEQALIEKYGLTTPGE